MGNAKNNLKKVVDNFISQSAKTLNLLKQNHGQLGKEELDRLAERIWELRHYSVELLDQHPDETSWYNASLIKDIVEQPLEIDYVSHTGTTLIQAADSTKKFNQTRTMLAVVHYWSENARETEILFEDLKQISQELAA